MVSYGVAKARAMARKSNWNEEEYTSKATITRTSRLGLKSTPRSLQERMPRQTAQPSRRWLESATIMTTLTTTRLLTGTTRLGQNSNGNAERGDNLPKHPKGRSRKAPTFAHVAFVGHFSRAATNNAMPKTAAYKRFWGKCERRIIHKFCT